MPGTGGNGSIGGNGDGSGAPGSAHARGCSVVGASPDAPPWTMLLPFAVAAFVHAWRRGRIHTRISRYHASRGSLERN
jgi:MYXO-CTERM domain-containing protein